jgi:hypothetical protein
MRERIAEALYRENRLHVTPWALVGPEVQGIYLARADAVLAVLADPSEAHERARYAVAGVHHVIGRECLCGARLGTNRDATEHIIDAYAAALADEKEARG